PLQYRLDFAGSLENVTLEELRWGSRSWGVLERLHGLRSCLDESLPQPLALEFSVFLKRLKNAFDPLRDDVHFSPFRA
ncbi:MAG: hypothetical protein U1E05_21790, partial [Patescibacteria group bacterium]|nr:hypothetical protein [Patescibacteria group bacterium]